MEEELESQAQSGAHLDSPAAVEHPAADSPSGVVQSQATAEQRQSVKPGTVALVLKGDDRIPVQLKNEAHLDQLKHDHGAGNVQVQT
jgi:hypothetical protein